MSVALRFGHKPSSKGVWELVQIAKRSKYMIYLHFWQRIETDLMTVLIFIKFRGKCLAISLSKLSKFPYFSGFQSLCRKNVFIIGLNPRTTGISRAIVTGVRQFHSGSAMIIKRYLYSSLQMYFASWLPKLIASRDCRRGNPYLLLMTVEMMLVNDDIAGLKFWHVISAVVCSINVVNAHYFKLPHTFWSFISPVVYFCYILLIW